MQDEREDCPAEHLTFKRYDVVALGYSTTPGAEDIRMDCPDCGMWAILRYDPTYPLDGLHEKLANLAPGRHASQFEAVVRGIRREEGRTA